MEDFLSLIYHNASFIGKVRSSYMALIRIYIQVSLHLVNLYNVSDGDGISSTQHITVAVHRYVQDQIDM